MRFPLNSTDIRQFLDLLFFLLQKSFDVIPPPKMKHLNIICFQNSHVDSRIFVTFILYRFFHETNLMDQCGGFSGI